MVHLLKDDRLAVRAAAGDERAFEVLYDRHHRALLGFCRHMLGSFEEAEDALQQTFLRAHRALIDHGPPRDLRPWLFAIARNRCHTLLAARHPEADSETEVASPEGLGEQVQARADLRAVVADVERLPRDQRAALVLSELADLSHDQIASVIGVRTAKVKALIHQARTTLIAERDARDTPCDAIREQLATARGGALRRGPLRRHLRACAPCRAYRDAVSEQRRALALALPATPSLGLKAGILGAASAAGGAGTAAVGGGFASKVIAGALFVGGATSGGVAIVERADPPPRPAPAAAEAAERPPATRAAPAPAAAPPAVAVTRGPGTRRAERTRHAGKAPKRAHGKRGKGPKRAQRRHAHGRPPAPSARSKARANAPARHPARRGPATVNSPRPVKPAKPVQPMKPMKPVTPAKPVEPPVSRMKPADPGQPTRPGTPAKG